MYILVGGINYRTAPVDIREKLTFKPTEFGKAMKALQAKPSVLENIILSTCNRTEIYTVVDDIIVGQREISEFLESKYFQKGKPTVDHRHCCTPEYQSKDRRYGKCLFVQY
ncbi:hypothetical protein WQ57_09975 [Mesobacillus campisalis]|uniref:Glutamyl-tRNA reductase N-terminal domain-containing protein n=1 Tax=Mesobacillus campisalis TaxID=1408103 RepID=A0A0M2SWP3_9BACI|nr:hypothetical protein [Mesobacillus campisalis]KKK38136.1 hypothetical protein WQ57_09975 [Mesobacillus campisalis]